MHPTVALLERQLISNELPVQTHPLYARSLLSPLHVPGPKLILNNVATIGASAMQPSGGTDGVTRVSADSKETLANLEDWWRRGEGGVSAYQVCHEEKIVSTQRYLGFMRKMSTH